MKNRLGRCRLYSIFKIFVSEFYESVPASLTFEQILVMFLVLPWMSALVVILILLYIIHAIQNYSKLILNE